MPDAPGPVVSPMALSDLWPDTLLLLLAALAIEAAFGYPQRLYARGSAIPSPGLAR